MPGQPASTPASDDPDLPGPRFTADFDRDWFDAEHVEGWRHVPPADVAVTCGSSVVSAAGFEVGRLEGFLCDIDGKVTHLVLQPGHRFGHGDRAIPIGLANQVERDLVRVALCRDEIARLPDVRVRRRIRQLLS